MKLIAKFAGKMFEAVEFVGKFHAFFGQEIATTMASLSCEAAEVVKAKRFPVMLVNRSSSTENHFALAADKVVRVPNLS